MAHFQGQKQFFGKSLNQTKPSSGQFTKKGKKKKNNVQPRKKVQSWQCGLVKNFLLTENEKSVSFFI